MFSRHIQELRGLIGKFREGTLTTDEVLGGYVTVFVIAPFLVIPGFALGLIDTEILVNDDKRVSYVSMIFFILFFLIMMILLSRSLPRKPSLSVQFYRMLGSAISAAVLSYICGIGYFLFWNTISGSSEDVLVSGPIVRMEVGTGGRFMGKQHFVSIYYDERDVKLTVAPEEYKQLSLSQTYFREMKLGGLGYYYNWGSSWWK